LIRIAICDDTREYLNVSRELVQNWFLDKDISVDIDCFCDGDGLLFACKSKYYDLFILDIIMPLLNGIDTAKELSSIIPSATIVFLTTSKDYALESYAVHAFDYILKPLNQNQIDEMLTRFIKSINVSVPEVILKTHDGYSKVPIIKIEYIEVFNKLTNITLIDGNILNIHSPLSSIEESIMNQSCFFKPHRSYIVNMSHVDHFSNSEIVTSSGFVVPIARGLGKQFQETYFNYIFSKERDNR